jgi:hypothetical protein
VTRLPAPAPGTASVPLDDGAVVFEPTAGQIHVLNRTGAVVWAACCDGLDEDDLVDELVAATGQSHALVARDVERCISSLRAAALVEAGTGTGVGADPGAVDEWVREPPDAGGDHRIRVGVLGEVVEVRTTSAWFHDQATELLADITTEAEATRWVVVEDDAPEGRTRIHGPRVGWRSHDDLSSLLTHLMAELNVVVASWTGGLALHAGVVRHPGGAVVALPGESGAGKSTLVAALVRAGWDYVSDEALGLTPDLGVVGYPKPLSLDGTSRGLVGLPADGPADVRAGSLRPGARTVGPGDGGRLSHVVLPDRRAPGGAELAPIDADGTLTTLAPFAMNLPASGRTGLRALVRASTDVPCWRLAFDGLDDAVGAFDRLAAG